MGVAALKFMAEGDFEKERIVLYLMRRANQSHMLKLLLELFLKTTDRVEALMGGVACALNTVKAMKKRGET